MKEKDYKMMNIEQIINDVVLIVLDDVEALRPTGISDTKFYARVIGYDEFGLWIEHPKYEIVYSEDESGKPLPADKIRKERLEASVLVHWRNIVTIVHFPNREGFDFPSPFEKTIGFESENSEEESDTQ